MLNEIKKAFPMHREGFFNVTTNTTRNSYPAVYLKL